MWAVSEKKRRSSLSGRKKEYFRRVLLWRRGGVCVLVCVLSLCVICDLCVLCVLVCVSCVLCV